VLPDPHAPALLLEHCPHCRGAVRPGAPWCTQCWTDLRPAPEPAPAVEAPVVSPAVAQPAGPVAVVQPPEAAVTEDDDAPAVTWPCSRCGQANALELSACSACGSGFLAAVRSDDPPLLVLPVVGDVGRLSKGQRYGLSAGIAFLAVLLVVVLGLIFG
jgi:hypothetical protein